MLVATERTTSDAPLVGSFFSTSSSFSVTAS